MIVSVWPWVMAKTEFERSTFREAIDLRKPVSLKTPNPESPISSQCRNPGRHNQSVSSFCYEGEVSSTALKNMPSYTSSLHRLSLNGSSDRLLQ